MEILSLAPERFQRRSCPQALALALSLNKEFLIA
jgi:hypothetical protein